MFLFCDSVTNNSGTFDTIFGLCILHCDMNRKVLLLVTQIVYSYINIYCQDYLLCWHTLSCSSLGVRFCLFMPPTELLTGRKILSSIVLASHFAGRDISATALKGLKENVNVNKYYETDGTWIKITSSKHTCFDCRCRHCFSFCKYAN